MTIPPEPPTGVPTEPPAPPPLPPPTMPLPPPVLPPGPPPAWGSSPAAWTTSPGEAAPTAGWAAPDGPALGAQGKDRLAAAALALILGGVGAHKFYLGRTGQGIVYLLLFWTGIPAFIAWIEGIMYLARSDESWAAEYGGPPQRPSSFGLGCLWLIALLPFLMLLSVVGLIFLGGQVGSLQSAQGPALVLPTAAPTAILEPIETAAPAGTAKPEPGATGDAEIAALEARVAADPKDVDALVQLGDIAYFAEDYEASAGWMTRALEVEPENAYALIALGACRFNLDDLAAAERHWKGAIAVDPRNQEAWYDLGYLHASQAPPDADAARQAWNRVLEIDPDTELATAAREGLAALEE